MDINFTDKAKQALHLAKDAAVSLNNNFIGSEHILLGLILEGTGVAAKIMKNIGVSADAVKREIQGFSNSYTGPKIQEIQMTPRTKKIFDNSIIEARKLGHNYIGTEHLLLSILNETDCVAFQILMDLNVDQLDLQNEFEKFHNNQEKTVNGVNANVKVDNNTPTINQFGRDLTLMAKEGKFDPVIGRNDEIQRIMQILSRRTKNNPCLIGEPGVGKTAIVEGLAQKIISGDVPETIKGKRLIALDLSAMVAGTKYRGEFEERLKKTIDEVISAKNIIMFIDEFHTIIGAGSAEGSMDAANILKPTLSRGDMQLIGATTINEYRKSIEKDAALERRFQSIIVSEPDVDSTLKILEGLRDKYEAHHNVQITDEALKAAVNLSYRYINDRFMPDKAIDLIDEASSRKKLKKYTMPPEIREIENEIEKLVIEKEEAITHQEFEKAATIRDKEKNLKAKLLDLTEQWKKDNRISSDSVTEEDIAEIVSIWTGIPVKKLEDGDVERLLHLEETLHKRVIGQNEAVTAISKAVRRGRTGLRDPKRPIGSFIFLGPTGVGKTELSRALAESLFGEEKALIRVDMSEYMEKHSISKLIGSPPGYVGFDEGGQLTEKIRRKPYSVVLFDEIEKAHPDIFNILLQIMEDGVLTDSQGRKVDFKNTVIIMTSNVGARNITDNKRLGFNAIEENSKEKYENIKKNIFEELRKMFRPEFLNRIDDIIVFQQLSKDEIKEITLLLADNLKKRSANNEIDLQFSDAVLDFIAEKGYDPIYGARPLKRAIQNYIEDAMAESILNGTIVRGQKIMVDIAEGKIFFLNL